MACAADIRPLMKLDREVSTRPWSEKSLSPYVSPSPGDSRFALVLEVAGEFVAFLLYTRLLDEANIDSVAVASSRQGRGCGRALLLAALNRMSEAGLQRCMLEVRESNLAARALYENNGFIVDGVRPRYYRTDQGSEDALLMSRRL